MKKTYKVEVDCAVCAQKIEDGIKKVDGVVSCNINFMTQKMIIEIADEHYNEVFKKAIKIAKKIESDFVIED